METQAQQIRSEPHVEIGSIIQRDATILIERWVQRATEEQPKAARVHHAVLLDHLPEFLHQMGRSLSEADVSNNGWHCPSAREHGGQRWESGWSLSEVVRDYQILRLVIHHYLEEALDRPIHSREAMAIGLVLDEAIAASVTRFGVFQQEMAKKAERERADNESHAEKQRLTREAEMLRAAERRTDEFLSVLSHELRNPLAPLRNSLHLLRLRGDDSTVREQARELAERQVHQITRLLEDLLDLSRVRQGKISLKKEATDLNVVVSRAIETSRPMIEGRQHVLEVALSPAPLPLEMDPARLEQVLVNLLNNAAKYTEKGGRIRVAVERIAGEVFVRIRDTGIGLAPETRERIFELYAQVEEARNRAEGGLGIGLSLVKGLVELHGGRVHALSDGPGQGSEFVVRLPAPATVPPPSTPPEPAAVSPPVQALRVLVVDDNKDSAGSLAVLIRLWGHHVETALDGPSALVIAKSFQPQAALLDIALPGLNGYELAKQIREQPALKFVVLVAVTGYGHEEARQRSQEASFDYHLVKPVDIGKVQQILESVSKSR